MITGKDTRRLLIVRETMDEARAIVSGNPTDYSLMKAVWLADLAVELTLASVAADLTLPVKKRPMFNDYLDAIAADTKHQELSALKLHIVVLDKLHTARNRIHDGLAFTQKDSRSLVQTAELFVQTAFLDVYGADLDTLSLTSFLNTGPARDHLEAAEAEMLKDDYSEAMLQVAIAFEIGRRHLSKQLRERNRNLWSEELFPSQGRMPHTVTLSEKAVKKVAWIFELSRFGIDVDRAIKYTERVPRAMGNRDEGPWISSSGIKRDYSKDEAQGHLEFVADVLYRFQTYAEKL